MRENGRITLMWCAFSGNPRIGRLYGHGTVHEIGGRGFEQLAGEFTLFPGARAIVEVAVTRISTSCGYSVPLMDLVEDRERLHDWARAALLRSKFGESLVSLAWAFQRRGDEDMARHLLAESVSRMPRPYLATAQPRLHAWAEERRAAWGGGAILDPES